MGLLITPAASHGFVAGDARYCSNNRAVIVTPHAIDKNIYGQW